MHAGWTSLLLCMCIMVEILVKILRIMGGGDVGIVDGCDPDKWSKVETESICKEFGYTCMSTLWYTIPREDDQEGRMFHLIKDDKDAMFMTTLVGGGGSWTYSCIYPASST